MSSIQIALVIVGACALFVIGSYSRHVRCEYTQHGREPVGLLQMLAIEVYEVVLVLLMYGLIVEGCAVFLILEREGLPKATVMAVVTPVATATALAMGSTIVARVLARRHDLPTEVGGHE